MPCSEKRAQLLLERGRARVHRVKPFTIRLVDRFVEDSELQPVELKLDPGSRHTGMALVRDDHGVKHCLNLYQLDHRGHLIHRKLLQRAAFRRNRRNHKTRYRPARFHNRTRLKGWLPPSLQHRVDSTLSWARKFQRSLPLTKLVVESNRFDTQLMDNPDIQGRDYQRGSLWDCELRECVFAKWGYTCVYCGVSAFDGDGLIMELDHFWPKSKGGSDSPRNRVPACVRCNRRKSNTLPAIFLIDEPEKRAWIEAGLKTPLKDAAAMNATRYKLVEAIERLGLPVETSTGGRTRWNRQRFDVPKTHALDALCAGNVNGVKDWKGKPTQVITCMGRGRYSRTANDKHGFPRGYLARHKRHFGFATGDLVRISNSLKKSTSRAGARLNSIYRITVSAKGDFRLFISGLKYCVHYSRCRVVQRSGGYHFSKLMKGVM